MPFRRKRFDPSVTLDLSGIDLGPPPDRVAPPRDQRSPSTATVNRAGINGLAGLCMLVLVVTGLGVPLPGGHLAADAILVVVGFQLGLGLIRLTGCSPRWLRRFWLSAIGPIVVPTVVAVGLVGVYWWSLGRLGPSEARGAIASLAMATNLGPLFDSSSFAATDHLWLIALIVQFAAVVPLAALVLRRTHGQRAMLHVVITLVAGVMVTRLMLALTGLTAASTLAQFPLTRVDGLLIGLGIAVAPRSLLSRLPTRAAPLSMVALLAVFTLAPEPDIRPAVTLGVLIPVVALGTAVIVATRDPSNHDALSRVLGGLGPRWLGERAISIYIWHRLFGMALEELTTAGLFGATWPGFSLFVTQLVFALAAGSASYRYLQLPVRAAIERLVGPKRRRSTAAASVDAPTSPTPPSLIDGPGPAAAAGSAALSPS